MKKLITILALLCLLPFYGQKRVAGKIGSLVAQKTDFIRFAPLVENKDAEASAGVRQATYASLDAAVVNTVYNTKPEYIEVDIPYNNGMVTLQMYRANLFVPGFQVATNGQQDVAVNEGAFYRGIIKGDASSVASLSFFKNEMSGIISGKQFNNLVVGKMRREGNIADYIIYSDRQLTTANPFACKVTDVKKFAPKPKNGGITTFDADDEKCVTLYFELDHEIFLENGSSMEATTNWMTGLFNNIQTLFFNDGINVALHSMFIWSTPDPYFGDDSGDYLDQFYESASFEADAGQLIGIDNGGFGGLAWLGALCSSFNKSYVDVMPDYEEVPLFSWNVEAMTHELGHQFGSPHTHACAWNGDFTQIDACGDYAGYPEGECESWILPENQGTIMSYCHLIAEVGINLAHGFGPQPIAVMIDFIESSDCVNVGCTSSICANTIAGIDITDVTPEAVTAIWASEAGDTYETSYSLFSEGFDEWTETSDISKTINGLQPNTYYEFGVRKLCEEGKSRTTKTVFATDADWCAGQVFTDTGGEDGNYEINQRFIRTFKPIDPEQKVKVIFTEFFVEQDFDYMIVYNGHYGDDIIGGYSGNDLPPAFVSTAEDGSLTFEFVSDEFNSGPGWVANVSCDVITAGQDNFEISGLSYYPNPSKGIVNVTAVENIQSISISNVSGQVLLKKEINANEAGVDISSFASGVYFFKVSNGTKEANFRIIKQ